MPTSTLFPNTKSKTEAVIDKNEELVTEIKKLTYQLKLQNEPWRRLARAFTTGIFTALGSLFGTLILVSLLALLLSRLPFTQNLINFFKNPPTPQSTWQLSLPELFQP